ncbi:hypothetical protein J6590_020475 [Homalodisca vitripennis]|nr:hypothetical protein J6590_020475 [Homalodisca vitripennis]
MGNSGSAQGGGGGGEAKRGWAHSYPRPAHKVLPERVPGQRLRLTHNGNILHSGGTLTGRKHTDHQVFQFLIGRCLIHRTPWWEKLAVGMPRIWPTFTS